MDNFLFDNSTIRISNGIIENISFDNNGTFVTISYADCPNCARDQRVRLVVGNNTRILDEFNNRIPVSDLRTGMNVDAVFSSAMTRSIPPQSTAFLIRVRRRPVGDHIARGRIINIDHPDRNFTILSGGISSAIRFNVPRNAIILDILGRPISFSSLRPGFRVQVRHASFMTASIPPQTTAFEVQVIR